MLEHITTLAADAQKRILSQYLESPEVVALIGALAEMVQPLEDAIWDLSNAQVLDTAVGVWLDNLGAIVGEAREGWGDTDFRRFIKARILANASSGTLDQLLEVVAFAYGVDVADLPVSYEEYPPAAVLLVVTPPLGIYDQPLRARVYRIAARARAAGVRFMINTGPEDADAFNFSSSDDAQPVLEATEGFSDSDDLNVGGEFASGDLA